VKRCAFAEHSQSTATERDLGLLPGYLYSYLEYCCKSGDDEIANADKISDRSKDVKASGPSAGVTPVELTLTCCSARSPEDLVSTKNSLAASDIRVHIVQHMRAFYDVRCY